MAKVLIRRPKLKLRELHSVSKSMINICVASDASAPGRADSLPHLSGPHAHTNYFNAEIRPPNAKFYESAT